MLTSKKQHPFQQRIFLNTFLPASDSRPSEPFKALISKHRNQLTTVKTCFRECDVLRIQFQKKTTSPPKKKGLLESLASQSHSRKLLQSHKHPFAAPKNARTTANQFLSESFQAISWAFFVCFYSVQCGPLLVIISRIITQVTHL